MAAYVHGRFLGSIAGGREKFAAVTHVLCRNDLPKIERTLSAALQGPGRPETRVSAPVCSVVKSQEISFLALRMTNKSRG